MTGKRCCTCGEVKPLELFGSNKKSPDGRHTKCKACKSAYSKARRAAASADQIAAEKERLRASYLLHKESKKRRRKDRYEQSREKVLAKNMEWRAANLERHRELCRKWARDNPDAMRAIVARRRALLMNAPGSYSAQDIAEMMAEQNGRCNSCKCSLDESGHNVDHVFPLSLGGSNGRENLQLLCPSCNRSKGAKLPHEWKPKAHP